MYISNKTMTTTLACNSIVHILRTISVDKSKVHFTLTNAGEFSVEAAILLTQNPNPTEAPQNDGDIASTKSSDHSVIKRSPGTEGKPFIEMHMYSPSMIVQRYIFSCPVGDISLESFSNAIDMHQMYRGWLFKVSLCLNIQLKVYTGWVQSVVSVFKMYFFSQI